MPPRTRRDTQCTTTAGPQGDTASSTSWNRTGGTAHGPATDSPRVGRTSIRRGRPPSRSPTRRCNASCTSRGSAPAGRNQRPNTSRLTPQERFAPVAEHPPAGVLRAGVEHAQLVGGRAAPTARLAELPGPVCAVPADGGHETASWRHHDGRLSANVTQQGGRIRAASKAAVMSPSPGWGSVGTARGNPTTDNLGGRARPRHQQPHVSGFSHAACDRRKHALQGGPAGRGCAGVTPRA